MVGEPDATMQPAPQENQLMSKHRVLSFKPQLRLERQGQDGQNETEQPDHSASLGDSITSSTQIRFSVHTGLRVIRTVWLGSIFFVVLVGVGSFRFAFGHFDVAIASGFIRPEGDRTAAAKAIPAPLTNDRLPVM